MKVNLHSYSSFYRLPEPKDSFPIGQGPIPEPMMAVTFRPPPGTDDINHYSMWTYEDGTVEFFHRLNGALEWQLMHRTRLSELIECKATQVAMAKNISSSQGVVINATDDGNQPAKVEVHYIAGGRFC